MILNDFSTHSITSFFCELNSNIHDSERQKPKTVEEDSIISLTKLTGTLIQQAQTEAQKTSHFKLGKSKMLFAFDLFLLLQNGGWMFAFTRKR